MQIIYVSLQIDNKNTKLQDKLKKGTFINTDKTRRYKPIKRVNNNCYIFDLIILFYASQLPAPFLNQMISYPKIIECCLNFYDFDFVISTFILFQRNPFDYTIRLHRNLFSFALNWFVNVYVIWILFHVHITQIVFTLELLYWIISYLI